MMLHDQGIVVVVVALERVDMLGMMSGRVVVVFVVVGVIAPLVVAGRCCHRPLLLLVICLQRWLHGAHA